MSFLLDKYNKSVDEVSKDRMASAGNLDFVMFFSLNCSYNARTRMIKISCDIF